MKCKNKISEYDLIPVFQGGLHAFAQRLPVMSSTVRTAQVFDEDRRIVFPDPGVASRNGAVGVGGGEVNLRFHSFGRPADQILVVAEGKLMTVLSTESTEREWFSPGRWRRRRLLGALGRHNRAAATFSLGLGSGGPGWGGRWL